MHLPQHPASGKRARSSKSNPGQSAIQVLAQETKAIIAGKVARRLSSIRRSSRHALRQTHPSRSPRDPRPLALALTAAALLVMTLLTSSVSISSVYDREVAPVAAQDGGLPAPPTDAAGHPLPASGTTVPQGGFSPQMALDGQASPQGSSCSGGGSHSGDGNPYPICPGPMPSQGGNCTWWSWEQWHKLGYNLPGWGDATYWATRAQAYGLQVGTVPRVNAIAVFPRGDGVWAFSDAGHVAFVTKVYSDLDTFDVTFQNYGDATLVHYGKNFRASVIQQPGYQDGEMRFIYFPGTTGGGGTSTGSDSITSDVSVYTGDFAGDGSTQVLRYDRTQGTMDILELSADLSTLYDTPLLDPSTTDGSWSSTWEVYTGDFVSGSTNTDILLYDRAAGKARFITLDSGFNIANDITQTGWKSTWEIYIGNFDGAHDELLFYDRQTSQDHGQWTPAPGEPAVPVSVTGAGASNTTPPGGNPPGYDPNSSDWEHHHRTATLAVFDYKSDFTVNRQVDFDRWHNTFEVRIGQFGPNGRDGIFFYDRTAGEIEIVTFDNKLKMSATYQQHKVYGGWEVYTGDFDGSLQSSLFLFDRSSGKAEALAFNPNMTLRREVDFSNWGQSWEFYVGHFGGLSSAAQSFLLYSRSAGVISFVGFGSDLTIANQARYSGFRSTWSVYVGHYGPACTSDLGSTTDSTPTDTSTPTNTATPNPNNEAPPGSPNSGTTMSVNQTCPDTVLLVDESTYDARLISFTFDNGLQNGQPSFSETPVPWITPTPTDTPDTTGVDDPPSNPTSNPTSTPTSTPTNTPTPTPTNTPASQPTNTPTPTPTNTPTPTQTNTPTPTPTNTPTSTPGSTATPAPTNTTAPQPTATPTPQPTSTPAPTPASTPTSQPKNTPTSAPSPQPTGTSTPQPTSTPTPQPTSTPSTQPTNTPTSTATPQPTNTPSTQPASTATPQPTKTPTPQPTSTPTPTPTSTASPTATP
ncbi:MAG TPA: CHAP domain-containing protein [Ktedonobacterales bacterium]